MKLQLLRMALLLTGLSLWPACAKQVSYTSADAPLHQGNYAQHTAAVPDSFTLVSYNIQYAEDIDVALAELQNSPRLKQADIILLQEMDPPGTETIARALAMNYVYYPASVNPHHARLFGNAVLSRWLITTAAVSILPHGHPFSGHRRIAVSADLQVGDHSLRVVSVHTATVVTEQDKRIEQARAALDSLTRDNIPIVIAGDFNTVLQYTRTLLRRLFRQGGYQQARLPAGPTVRSQMGKLLGLELILDHIFYRQLDLLSCGVHKEATASDHFPIWAVFTWLPGNAKTDDFLAEEQTQEK